MKQTAALIVFESGLDPKQAKRLLTEALAAAKRIGGEEFDDFRVERIQTQEFDVELGPVVLYQP